jgi:hypothetical protein
MRHLALACYLALSSLPRLARGDAGRTPTVAGVAVSVPAALAAAPSPVDRVLLRAKPLVRRIDGAGAATLVLGLPGRSTSSQSMISFLTLGLAGAALDGSLVIATLEDPVTGGPLRQGHATRQRRNRWLVDPTMTRVLRRFASAVAVSERCQRAFIVGYSSGGAAAPWVAAQLAGRLGPARLEGVVAIAASSATPAAVLRAAGVRLLYLLAPARAPDDHDLVQSDARTRRRALERARRLAEGGVTVYVREVESARRHSNWHWGVISPCRFEAHRARGDPGRWPDYTHPGRELFTYVVPFLQRQEPPRRAPQTDSACADAGPSGRDDLRPR